MPDHTPHLVRRILRKAWAAWCAKAAILERRYDDAEAWRKWGNDA